MFNWPRMKINFSINSGYYNRTVRFELRPILVLTIWFIDDCDRLIGRRQILVSKHWTLHDTTTYFNKAYIRNNANIVKFIIIFCYWMQILVRVRTNETIVGILYITTSMLLSHATLHNNTSKTSESNNTLEIHSYWVNHRIDKLTFHHLI